MHEEIVKKSKMCIIWLGFCQVKMEFSVCKQQHMATEMYIWGEHMAEMNMVSVLIDCTLIA